MKSGIEIRGLDAFQKRLKVLARNAASLHGEHKIPIRDLLSVSFMRRHTKLDSFEAFVGAGGFELGEDAAVLNTAEWDTYVAESTSFSGWQEMKSTAVSEWAKSKLLAD